MSTAVAVMQAAHLANGHALQPNEFDLRRIARMLETRARYRYVQPVVECIENGYCIQSPCCSRKIDATGGIIDVARLEYDAQHNVWNLYRKNHAQNRWEFHLKAQRLDVVMTWLNEDPARIFWQ
jgi:hypothetical protein